MDVAVTDYGDLELLSDIDLTVVVLLMVRTSVDQLQTLHYLDYTDLPQLEHLKAIQYIYIITAITTLIVLQSCWWIHGVPNLWEYKRWQPWC